MINIFKYKKMNSSLLPDSLRSKPGSDSFAEMIGPYLTTQEVGRLASTSRRAADEFGSGKRGGEGERASYGVLEKKKARLLFLLDQIVPDRYLRLAGGDQRRNTLREHLRFYYIDDMFNPNEVPRYYHPRKKLRLMALVVLMIIDGDLLKLGTEAQRANWGDDQTFLFTSLATGLDNAFVDRDRQEIFVDARRLLTLAMASPRDINSDITRQLREELRQEEGDDEEDDEGGGSRKRLREGMGGGKTYYKF